MSEPLFHKFTVKGEAVYVAVSAVKGLHVFGDYTKARYGRGDQLARLITGESLGYDIQDPDELSQIIATLESHTLHGESTTKENP